MAKCPALFSSLCELTQYLPFSQPSGQQIVSLLFGMLVVIVFSIDHYKVPTYAKTTIGEFIELAPESLTSHSRYVKGLGIYIALMLTFYAVLLAIGPTAISPVLAFMTGKPDGNTDGATWPLAATSIITLIGSGDDRYLGRLEGWLRSIAHEAAYIPYAVTNLSAALDGSFPLADDELRAAGELTPDNQALIRDSQEGFRQNWIRAKYLYSRLELLRDRDDEFKQLMRQPENERALRFVDEQRVVLCKEVNRSEPDETLTRRIGTFKNALAVFLASILWRGCNTESAVRAKLAELKLNVGRPESRSSASFMFHVFAYLGATALAWISAFQFRQWQFHDASVEQKWHLTLAFLVFLLTAMFVTRWREKQLTSGDWRYSSDAMLRCTVFCTIAIGAVSVIVTYALHQGGIGRFYAMLLVGFGMALPSAFLFQLLMQWAASSPPTNEAVAARIAFEAKPSELMRTTVFAGALYAGIAFTAIIGPLYWLSEFRIVMSTPQQIVDAATDIVGNIEAAYHAADENDKWFTSFVSPAALDDLAAALKAAEDDLSSNSIRPTTIPNILAKCDALGKLAADRKLFNPGCELGDDLKTIPYKGDVLPLIYNLQFQISSLVPKFDALKHYDSLLTAVEYGWRNALLASLMWAVMAAVFAVSVLLYRRQVLWDCLVLKKLPDFVPLTAPEREAWLRKPLYDMGKLSPLEALRYPAYRAGLADHVNAQDAHAERPRLQIVA